MSQFPHKFCNNKHSTYTDYNYNYNKVFSRNLSRNAQSYYHPFTLQLQTHFRIIIIIIILCLWFCASLIYINNCPTRCNTKQSIYYSASSLYVFWVSTTPPVLQLSPSVGQVSLATLEGGSCTKNMTSTGGCSYSFVYS